MSPRRPIAALAFLFLIVLAPLGGRSAAAATEASGIVTQFGDSALKMLNDQSLTQADRTKRFHDLLDQDFDFDRIARFVLGRYWQSASDQERQQFAAAFKDYVVKTYSQRFNEFTGISFKVTSERPENDTSTIIHTDIERKAGAPAKVDFRVAKGSDGYKISEVIVDGVSMSLTHRQEFASIMDRNGGKVGALINELRQKTGT